MPRRTSTRIRRPTREQIQDAVNRVKTRMCRYEGDFGYVDIIKAAPDPWAAVDAIVKREIEPTGPEWFTPRQFADRYHVSLNRAHEVCNRLAKEGKLRRWKGTSLTTHKTATKYAPA